MPRRKQRYIDMERAALAAAAKPEAQPTPEWPRYMTYQTVAKYLGQSYMVAYRWIRRYVDEGKLVVNETTKAHMVDRLDVDRLWKEGAETAA